MVLEKMEPTLSAERDQTLVLPSGVGVSVRAIRPDDVPALRRFHGRCSGDTVYPRFLDYPGEFPEEEARYFSHVDGADHRALVALDPGNPDEIIAVVRYDRKPGSERAEYAAIIEDRWQEHGLGLSLTRQLIDEARDNGIRYFYAFVMVKNTRMLRLLRHLDLPEHEHREDGVKRVEIELVHG